MSYVNKFSFIVNQELSGVRLDKFLVNILEDQKYGLSREKIKQLILQGDARLNDEVELSPKKMVKEGDNVTLSIPEPKSMDIIATEIPLNIIYEDADLLVINKQSGLTTHPGNGNRDNTLVNALLAYKPDNLSKLGGVERPGIVHRLDKNTSGLIVVAKNDHAHVKLSEQLQERTLKREYVALVWGMMSPDQGMIDMNIVRSSRNRKLMDVSTVKGKTAITHYETQEIFAGGLLSLVDCRLETGRTHQIRVHFSNSGNGVFGDPEYGSHERKLKKYFDNEQDRLLFYFKRQALHARRIRFQHPVSEEFLEFEIDLPKDIEKILDYLREKKSKGVAN